MQSETVYAFTIALVLLRAYRFRDQFAHRQRGGSSAARSALAALTRAEAAFLVRRADRPPGAHRRAMARWWRTRLLRGGARARRRRRGAGPVGGPQPTSPSRSRPVMSSGSRLRARDQQLRPDLRAGAARPTRAGNPGPARRRQPTSATGSPQCDRTAWPAGDETVVEAGQAPDRPRLHEGTTRRSFPVVLAARVGRIWDVWRPRPELRLQRVLRAPRPMAAHPACRAMIMYYAMLRSASLAALVVLWRRRVTIIPFVAIAISVTLTAAVSFGITRYRVGADVALCILGGRRPSTPRCAVVPRRRHATPPIDPTAGDRGRAGARRAERSHERDRRRARPDAAPTGRRPDAPAATESWLAHALVRRRARRGRRRRPPCIRFLNVLVWHPTCNDDLDQLGRATRLTATTGVHARQLPGLGRLALLLRPGLPASPGATGSSTAPRWYAQQRHTDRSRAPATRRVYSLFLGLLQKIGIGTPTGQRLATARWSPSSASSSSPWSTRRLAGRRAGLIAGVIARGLPAAVDQRRHVALRERCTCR